MLTAKAAGDRLSVDLELELHVELAVPVGALVVVIHRRRRYVRDRHPRVGEHPDIAP